MMNMDPFLPTDERQPILAKNRYTYFEDFRFTFLSRPILAKGFEEINKSVLQSPILLDYIKEQIHKSKSSNAI
jgi:hypothetical protein